MASGPITSWQIVGERVEVVTDFLFLGSKITADHDCIHKIRIRSLLGRKAMIILDSVLKSRDITLLTKVRIVKAVVFPVKTKVHIVKTTVSQLSRSCESWTVRKAECHGIAAFEMWC